MKVLNLACLSPEIFQPIADELEHHQSLLDILKWARKQPDGVLHPEIISDLVVQDEFTHDLIIPWNHLYFVYGST
jgi:hypothetical protein